MPTKSNTLNFKDQVFDVGIDVHKKNWSVTIRTNSIALKTFSMNPSPKELYNYMIKNYPGGAYRSVYEAGFCGYWIHRELTALGFNNIVTNAADVPTTHKEKDRKNDTIDSRKLCRELEKGSLKGIFTPTPEQEALRSISRLLHQYSKRNTQVKTRVKSFLDYLGIKTPETLASSHWSKNYITWLSNIQFTEPCNRYVLDEHIEELEYLRKKRLKLLGEIRSIGKTIPTIDYIRSIPGFGQICAFTLYVELIDIKRFRNLSNLAAYVGFVPSTESSGNHTVVKGISQRHNGHLRHILIEAAWIAVRNDPALTSAFTTFVKRMKKQRAIIQIAKKLLNRIRYVWLNQKEYVKAVVE
jgi:transposase